ncbi:hypothetical protein [Microbacterium arborescens]|uniref:hypothetical protein n=1 Tax=Microbacterium arborescens TaxID=33883 RepID=UPI000DF774F2|nr:hypothetical protein [Microbacterium arborescens]
MAEPLNTEATRTLQLAVADLDAAIANVKNRRATLAAEVTDLDAQIDVLTARRTQLAVVLPTPEESTEAEADTEHTDGVA